MTAGTLSTSIDERLREAGRRLVDRRPEFEHTFLRVRDAYARAYIRARMLRYRLRFDAAIDPYRLLSVDPASIEDVAEFDEAKFRNAGRVVAGDWDDPDCKFTDMDVFRAYERHFEDGVRWEDTAFFERIVGEIESGYERWGCSSRAEFEERCRRLDTLYESIAENGYRTQAELADRGDDPIRNPQSLKTERYKDEIAVHIGRDGDLLFEDGRNRLSIAKLLDLDEVPVRVLRRHADWQATRDAYVRGDPRVEHRGDHPDLAALSFGSASKRW